MISEIIEKWIKGILIDGITGNLSGLFDNVNAKVGEIASDVGSTPQAWNSGIFNMLRSLSETVVLPIAAAILALVMCHELIQMITEKNNMHDFDTSMFFRWIFKSAFAILIVSNTWNIVMGVFDATQSVVNQSSGVIIGETCLKNCCPLSHPCWGVPSPNPALASHRWCECGVSHYIALSIPERAFIIFTGGRIWLK